MLFPENAKKSEKQFLKKIYIENLQNSVKDHEQRIKGFEKTIKDYRKLIAETKRHIKKYQSLIKDAEDTVI